MAITYFENPNHRMIPGVYFPVRATLVETNQGSVLISPISFTEEQIVQIRAQGTVTAIVEPNVFHNLWANEAKEHFPGATLWASPGLTKRNSSVHPDKILSRDPWPFESELNLISVDGMPDINEIVFLHKPTRTLITTDLVFNVENPRGFLTPIVFRMMGFYKKLAVSKIVNSRIKDPAAFRASLRKILEQDFSTLITAHGSIIGLGAKMKLEKAFKERDLL